MLEFLLKICYRAIEFTKGNIIQRNIIEKDFSLLSTKVIKKYLKLVTLKITINYFWNQKQKIDETIKNSYTTTQNYREPKHYWYKISFYRTSRNFLLKRLKMLKRFPKCFWQNSRSPSYSETGKTENISWQKNTTKMQK